MSVELRVEKPDDLASEAAAEVDAASLTPFQTLAYARALDSISGNARVARVLEAGRVLGHAIVRVDSPMGYARWDGVGAPAIRGDALRFWEALVEGARATRFVSLAWREPTVTRFDVGDATAAREACERTGARLVVGALHGHHLALDEGAQATWARFDRRHRNAARHAERDGVRVERAGVEGAAEFADLSAATWARSSKAGLPRAYFERLLALPWIELHLARGVGGAIAGAIVAREGDRALYLHGASAGEGARGSGASQLLQWHIVQELAARGVRAYDLGAGQPPGSPGDDVHEQGIRRFKERFGGEARVRPTLHVTPDVALYKEAQDAVSKARISRS